MRHPIQFSVLVLLLIFQVQLSAFAQSEKQMPKEPWSVGVNSYYGALFRYRSGTQPLNFTHLKAFEVYANRHTLGKRRWERTYKHPQIGVALSYYNYGVPDELGEALSLTAYLDNSIVNFGKASLRYNLGTGIVYSTRRYTPITNEENKAIGSTFAFSLRGTLRYEFPVSEKVYMNLNLAFRHFSNGALNKPNNGMNFPMLGVGVRYQPKEIEFIANTDTAGAAFDKRIRFNLRATAGKKEVLYEDKKYPVYNLSVYASKQLTETNILLLGADGFRNHSLREEFLKMGAPYPEKEIDPRMAGITVGHELQINRLSFVFQLGRYVYEPNNLFPDYYQRYGLKYNVTSFLSANAMLMAHTRTANVIEWGLGLHL